MILPLKVGFLQDVQEGKEMDAEKLKRELFSLLTKKGAKLMGVADLSRIVDGVMRTGVSVAVPVPKNTDLCGLCFAVCPYTQRYLKRQA